MPETTNAASADDLQDAISKALRRAYPHTFVMGSIVCGTGGITHVMPYSPPPAPKE